MPAGGKRAGAGRPRALTATECLEAGELCEQLWLSTDKWKRNRDKAIADAIKNIDPAFQRIREIPVHLRKAWLQGHCVDGFPTVAEHREHREAIRRNLRARTIEVKVTRPKGPRLDVIGKVADLYARRGILVGDDKIEWCWKAYRRAIKEGRISPVFLR